MKLIRCEPVFYSIPKFSRKIYNFIPTIIRVDIHDMHFCFLLEENENNVNALCLDKLLRGMCHRAWVTGKKQRNVWEILLTGKWSGFMLTLPSIKVLFLFSFPPPTLHFFFLSRSYGNTNSFHPTPVVNALDSVYRGLSSILTGSPLCVLWQSTLYVPLSNPEFKELMANSLEDLTKRCHRLASRPRFMLILILKNRTRLT